ncbi:hypothetical protein B0H13DRAFT_137891 [Mycena leptocephala]|nr:hypothetical protein B0H13DRAFT_137891 [Mycena leptocephala]
MHPVLQIPELVDMICGHLGPERDHNRGVCSENGDLVALATTCSIFLEPSLNALWRHQTSFAPTMACMPGDLWDNPVVRGHVNHLETFRGIRPSDWQRPRFYLSRVRSMSCAESDMPSDGLCGMLASSLPMQPLFPKLISLELYLYDPSLLPCIHFLLGPRLTNLSLTLGPRISDLSSLPTILVKCPYLTRVSLGCETEERNAVRESTSQLVRGLTGVEQLLIDDFDQFAFAHLAMLPSLKLLMALRLRGFVPSTDSSALRGAQLFPSLEDIFLIAESNTAAIGWINLLSASPITKFGICLAFVPTATETESLYASLANNLPHLLLHTLKIDAALTEPADQISSSSDSEYSIKSDAFRLLFCFHNLMSISLTVCGGLDLDDSLVSEMARSWPKLESLTLKPECPHHVDRHITLTGLCALAQSCHELRSIELDINATAIPAVVGQAQLNLRKLHLPHSPIGNPSAVASFLFSVFPNLSEISATPTPFYAYEEDDLVEAYRMHWTAVGKTLATMRDAQSL